MRCLNSKCALLVCKDTGAANAFSIFLKNWNDTTTPLFSVCVNYAVNVFKNNGIQPTKESPRDLSENEVKQLLDEFQPGAILLGTSHDSWTERFFCKQARIRGIYCVGFVDWWSNFGARFSTPNTNDLSFLPNLISVMDEDARLGCIADNVPEELLRITGNPYWDHIAAKKEDIEQLRKQVRKQLRVPKQTLLAMVFSSNIRNLNLNLGYDEHSFWEALVPLPEYSKQNIPIQWALKPHPRERQQDIIDMLKKYHINPLIIDDFSAIEAVAAADFIIGMCSSVLFEAALLGKKVVSLQPGLLTGKLEYLRIFDHIMVPKVVNISEVKDVVYRLINNELGYSDLRKIPSPIGKGTANSALQALLLGSLQS